MCFVCTVPRVEFVLELVAQIVLEFVFEGIGEAGYDGVRAVWRHVVGRAFVHGLAGLAFGAWWAERLDDGVRTVPPNLLWVSLVLAVGGTVGALVAAHLDRDQAASGPQPRPNGFAPWTWPPSRWVLFAVLNAGLATGVLVAFDGPG